MKREKSCGAVVFTRRGDQILYVLICSRQGSYGFPKGHMERGETEQETAIREIREETGLNVTLLDGFRETDLYTLHRSGRQSAMKLVVYFLAEYADQETRPQESEVSEVVLLPLEEALERVSFESARALLRKADARLHAKHEKRPAPEAGAVGSGAPN